MRSCPRLALVLFLAFAACGSPTYVPPPVDETGKDAGQNGGGQDGPETKLDNRLVFPDLPPAADVVEKLDTSSCSFDICGPQPDMKPGSVCGNGVVEEGENCDDGNSMGGDCCDGVCHKEPFCECPTAGQMCMSTIVCGDSKKDGNEACDDGN